MKRLVEQRLLQWKSSPNRKPLLIYGARQIGKTYSILVGSCLVFSLFGTAIAAVVLNHILKEQLGLAVSVFLVGPLSVLLMAAVAAVVALLGTFFPVFFAARKKPVDTIRSL